MQKIYCCLMIAGGLSAAGCYEDTGPAYEENRHIVELTFLATYDDGYRRGRLRDLGGNLVVFETPDKSHTVHTPWFFARKCAQGFHYDERTNRCTDPAQALQAGGVEPPEGQPAASFQMCPDDLPTCDWNRIRSDRDRSPAQRACAGQDSLGLEWKIATREELRCIFGRHAAPTIYAALAREPIWDGSPVSGYNASAFHLLPGVSPGYVVGNYRKTTRQRVLCVAYARYLWSTCLEQERPIDQR